MNVRKLRYMLLVLALDAWSNPAAGVPDHSYVVTIDAGLAYLDVSARIASGTTYLGATGRDAVRVISQLRHCDGRRLSVRDRRIVLDPASETCLRYRALLPHDPLSRRAGPGSGDRAFRISSPDDWLWLPVQRKPRPVSVRLELPPGVRASVPWVPVASREHSFRLDPSPAGARPVAVFGDFPQTDIEVPGAMLRAAFPGVENRHTELKLVQWLREAAGNVTQAYGRFPNPSPQVLVVDARSARSSAVPFGRVARTGGEAVQFFADTTASAAELRDDWTATHEFSHLLLPLTDQKWISEGFATYHQNILLARAGVYDEARVWQRLTSGLERGRRSAPRLSPVEASRAGLNNARMKIYWAGVALALMADVELRLRSGGRQSLDTLLEQLQGCCLPATRRYGATELLRKLDSFTETPVLVPLFERHANARGFPDYEPLLRRLGVTGSDGNVVLDPDAELRAIRDALIAPYER